MSTNNLISNILANSTQAVPEVGMGATALSYSDRRAFTIVKASDKQFTAQKDEAKRADNNGMSDMQTYTYTPDSEGYTRTVTLRKNGKWITKGESISGGTVWRVGERMEFYDFSF